MKKMNLFILINLISYINLFILKFLNKKFYLKINKEKLKKSRKKIKKSIIVL